MTGRTSWYLTLKLQSTTNTGRDEKFLPRGFRVEILTMSFFERFGGCPRQNFRVGLKLRFIGDGSGDGLGLGVRRCQ